jgi:hypothetical protein
MNTNLDKTGSLGQLPSKFTSELELKEKNVYIFHFFIYYIIINIVLNLIFYKVQCDICLQDFPTQFGLLIHKSKIHKNNNFVIKGVGKEEEKGVMKNIEKVKDSDESDDDVFVQNNEAPCTSKSKEKDYLNDSGIAICDFKDRKGVSDTVVSYLDPISVEEMEDYYVEMIQKITEEIDRLKGEDFENKKTIENLKTNHQKNIQFILDEADSNDKKNEHDLKSKDIIIEMLRKEIEMLNKRYDSNNSSNITETNHQHVLIEDLQRTIISKDKEISNLKKTILYMEMDVERSNLNPLEKKEEIKEFKLIIKKKDEQINQLKEYICN